MFETSVPNPRLLVSAKNSTETTASSMSRANAKIGMLTGARKIVPFAGLVMRTTGGTLDIEPRTLICTGSEAAVRPLVSVALAVRIYSPANTFDQTRQNGLIGLPLIGLLVLMPMLVVPAKNSTVDIIPPT